MRHSAGIEWKAAINTAYAAFADQPEQGDLEVQLLRPGQHAVGLPCSGTGGERVKKGREMPKRACGAGIQHPVRLPCSGTGGERVKKKGLVEARARLKGWRPGERVGKWWWRQEQA